MGGDESGTDNYLDPHLLLKDPTGTNDEKLSFFTSRLKSGIEGGYQHRNEYNRAISYLNRVSGDYYFGNFQTSFSYTHRNQFSHKDRNSSLFPKHRVRTSLGWYDSHFHKVKTSNPELENDESSNAITEGKKHRLEPHANRILGGWIGDERMDGEWVNEMYLELSTKLLPTQGLQNKVSFFDNYYSGYFYAWQPAKDEHFIGYDVRTSIYEWKNGSNLPYGFGISGGKTEGEWDYGAFQNRIGLDWVEFLPRCNLNLGYMLTRDLHRGKWNHQAVLFLDIDIFSIIH